MTPLLLANSWRVTSVIRDESQKDEVLSAAKEHPELIDVLVSSLEDVKTQADAKKIIDQSRASCVVWSAGAGGKGGPGRTQAIDRDSCIHFIKAAASTPSVTKFLLVSYLGSRRNKAPWWSDEEWAATEEVNNGALKSYYPAKLAADESLTAAAGRSEHLQAIVLRPGSLTDDKAVGKVSLGRTKARGTISRADVAAVATRLLDIDIAGPFTWLDVLEGDEPVEDAVQGVVEEKVNCIEGEDLIGLERSLTAEER
ncbi:MAG: hypothetical protein LQ346_000350 [Caloplaca aetnensis]|nr:MAG: hypothetical protein LQ346_000350 [Caloplaca aetnensis]